METRYTIKSDEGNLIGSLKQFKKAAVVALTLSECPMRKAYVEVQVGIRASVP